MNQVWHCEKAVMAADAILACPDLFGLRDYIVSPRCYRRCQNQRSAFWRLQAESGPGLWHCHRFIHSPVACSCSGKPCLLITRLHAHNMQPRSAVLQARPRILGSGAWEPEAV